MVMFLVCKDLIFSVSFKLCSSVCSDVHGKITGAPEPSVTVGAGRRSFSYCYLWSRSSPELRWVLLHTRHWRWHCPVGVRQCSMSNVDLANHAACWLSVRSSFPLCVCVLKCSLWVLDFSSSWDTEGSLRVTACLGPVCCMRLVSCMKLFSQWEHLEGLSPLWISRCLLRVFSFMKFLPPVF